jgi:hypothetical protein
MRRQFELAEEDVQGLLALGLEWEAIIDGNTKWLLVHGYPIREGYNHRQASAALRISPSYPDDQIDMVYFSPALALASGRAIRQLTLTVIDGKHFQQWSRHRTAQNPWRPSLDNISTHLLQVNNWLDRELA